MTAFSDVFARKEKKYLLDPAQFAQMLAVVEAHLAPTEFGCSTVRSLYFDTPEYALIERSLDKPLYKEKLRLRTYGEPSATNPVFLEIKKKFKGIVYKRRVSMSQAAARAYLNGESYEQACARFPLADAKAAKQSLSPRSIHIAREIDVFRARYGQLAPSMLIACTRHAFADTKGSELRVTFDSDIVADASAKGFACTQAARGVVQAGWAVMEIKNAGSLPQWLVDALSTAKAYPRSFSKYGNAYLLFMRGEVPSLRGAAHPSVAEQTRAHAQVQAPAATLNPQSRLYATAQIGEVSQAQYAAAQTQRAAETPQVQHMAAQQCATTTPSSQVQAHAQASAPHTLVSARRARHARGVIATR